MDDVLRSLVQAFEGMAGAYQLLAGRLDRELDHLRAAHSESKDYTERLEAKATDLVSQNRRLAQLVADLETKVTQLETQKEVRQEQLKTDLAPVAHEIWTRLTALKGALSILLHEEPTDPETRRSLLNVAFESVERVMQLIGNII
ncbi:MAG: histidine kinase dimerization/phospho-acceptor domain-containing protein [Candidatus Methylomirabilales bacterium]